MVLAIKIQDSIERSSWIRKMFEEGARLKALYGSDKVFDFSLGNPDLEPPEDFRKVLTSVIKQSTTGAHGYMPNAGYEETRANVADYLSREQGEYQRHQGDCCKKTYAFHLFGSSSVVSGPLERGLRPFLCLCGTGRVRRPFEGRLP